MSFLLHLSWLYVWRHSFVSFIAALEYGTTIGSTVLSCGAGIVLRPKGWYVSRSFCHFLSAWSHIASFFVLISLLWRCIRVLNSPSVSPRCFSIKLHRENSNLRLSGDISPRHAQNPLWDKGKKTLSITHHALSPPPSHHHLYIIHPIN